MEFLFPCVSVSLWFPIFACTGRAALANSDTLSYDASGQTTGRRHTVPLTVTTSSRLSTTCTNIRCG